MFRERQIDIEINNIIEREGLLFLISLNCLKNILKASQGY